MNIKFTKSALVRLLVFLLSLLNLALVNAGLTPIEISNEAITSAVSALFTVATGISGVWAWWKNNSGTHGAKLGDRVKSLVNNGNLDFLSELQALLDKYELMHIHSEFRKVKATDEEESSIEEEEENG